MGRRDDELLELADQIKEQLQALPGGTREGEFQLIVAPNNRGNVAGGHQVIINPKRREPESDDMARICPQCVKRTWRFSQKCMHCDIDLFAHDAAWHARRVERRKFVLMGSFGAVGLAGLYLAQHLPEGMSGWALGIAGMALFLALLLSR
ncbi:MAG: hypothetical protein ACK4KV_19100 [Rhodocyclaceae bacterium]